jgi:hypothetical protein
MLCVPMDYTYRRNAWRNASHLKNGAMLWAAVAMISSRPAEVTTSPSEPGAGTLGPGQLASLIAVQNPPDRRGRCLVVGRSADQLPARRLIRPAHTDETVHRHGSSAAAGEVGGLLFLRRRRALLRCDAHDIRHMQHHRESMRSADHRSSSSPQRHGPMTPPSHFWLNLA